MSISKIQVELFQSLFKGREDIYAKRWERKDQSGYMPAYDVDREAYEKHKAQGGTVYPVVQTLPNQIIQRIKI